MSTHYSPVHRGTLTNHLPMFEQAMRWIGFDEGLVSIRSEAYIKALDLKNLEAAPAALTALEQTYMDKLPMYQHYIESQGLEMTLKAFLADKKDCMGSALFHGMIRLAFAVDAGDSEEIARALAYFDAAAEPMILPKGRQTREPKQAWRDLMALRSEMTIEFPDNATMSKVKHILANEALMAQVSDIVIEEDTEKRMCFIFANWYMKTRDFYVLHVNTGYQALMVLKPYIEDFGPWLQTYWKMAQVISLFTRERLPIIKISVNPWEQILEEAKAMTDAHDVKLVYACQDLYCRYGPKVLKKIAHITSHKYWGSNHHH